MRGPARWLPEVPAWVPLAAWPVLVLVALGGGVFGGAVAVALVVGSVASEAVLLFAAAVSPDGSTARPDPPVAGLPPADEARTDQG